MVIVGGLLVGLAVIAGSALAPRSNAPVLPTASGAKALPPGHPDLGSGSGAAAGGGGAAAGGGGAAASAGSEQALEQALAAAEADVRTSPRDVGALVRLADAYLQGDRSADAERTYTKVLQLDEGNVEAQAGLAMVRIVRGKSEQAMADLKRLAERHPRQQTVLYDLAIAYFATNQRELAGQTWRRVVGLGKDTDQGRMAAQFLSIMKSPGTPADASSP